jgi:hypothetical protein
MIKAGHEFIELMHSRGAVLLDTEMVLGCPHLGYTGQPDKVWLFNKNGELGIIISDYKSNKPKNFESHWYTIPMLKPFEQYDDTALSHYYLQLPFYVRLLLQMLKGQSMKIYLSSVVSSFYLKKMQHTRNIEFQKIL